MDHAAVKTLLCFQIILALTVCSQHTARADQSRSPETSLLLPATVWAVPRVECNLYFNSLLPLASRPLFWDVSCQKGRQMQARWTWTPGSEEAGSTPLEITATDDSDQKIAAGKTTVRVAQEKAGAGKPIRILIVGDSLTASGMYTGELLKLLAGPNEPSPTLLGTQGDAKGNRHEGYPGWTWRRFLTINPTAGPPSPFVFDGKINFSEYLRTHCEGTPPDFIVVFLGTNDVFGLSEAARATAIAQVLADAERLIGILRAGAPQAAIGLVIPLSPASQDAFGANYGSGETRRGYVKSLQLYTTEFLKRFDAREGENIHIIPAALNFDSENGYPVEQQSVHARSDAKVTRQINAVHPAVQGYRQVADAIFAWIKNSL